MSPDQELATLQCAIQRSLRNDQTAQAWLRGYVEHCAKNAPFLAVLTMAEALEEIFKVHHTGDES